MLGEFEYLLLSAAARLGEGAYGAAIRREIEDATKFRCSIGALYTTLDRLEAKGLVRTWMGDPTPERGGRPKRRVELTGEGVRQAKAFYSAVSRVSRGVSWAARPTRGRP
jgi:PadR family transcriptional regulator PadR